MRNKNWSAGTRIRFKTGIAMVLTACMVMGTVSPLCVHAEEDVAEEPDTILTEVSGDDIVEEDIAEDDILEEDVVENDIAEEEILMGEDSLDCLDEPSLEREGGTDGDFEYELKSSRYVITKYNGSATELTIPAELGGKKITAIAEGAFQDNATIKNLTIPEGIVESLCQVHVGTFPIFFMKIYLFLKWTQIPRLPECFFHFLGYGIFRLIL